MKVLIATPLYPPDIGGPATYARTLERELGRREVEVDVVNFGSIKHLPRGVRHIVYLFRLLRATRGVDVVLALDPFSVGLPATFAAFFARKKLVVRVAGDFAWEQGVQRFGVTESLDEFAKRKEKEEYHLAVVMMRTTQRFVVNRARRVIVPSKYMKKVVASWGVPKEKVVVVYSCIADPGEMGNKRTIRGLLHFSGKLVTSVGRLVPWKGFKRLIEVIGELRATIPDIKLFIVGSGPDADELERHVEALGLEEHVVLAGALEHEVLLRYVSVSDAFVLNTAYEGFSHQLLETMMVGVPVVTTNVGGNPELIKNGENGMLVPYNNKKSLRNAIKKVLTDRALARHLSTAGKKTAATFNEKRMADETLTVLTSV